LLEEEEDLFDEELLEEDEDLFEEVLLLLALPDGTH
jgi:hypothetical protein